MKILALDVNKPKLKRKIIGHVHYIKYKPERL